MVIRIKILNVVVWFVWVVIFHTRVVGFCLLLAHDRDTTMGPLLNEQMHVHICQQLQLTPTFFSIVFQDGPGDV